MVIKATNFRKNLFKLLDQTIRFSEPLIVNTKTGNAVIISEEDYRCLVETACLSSDAKNTIEEGLHTPLDRCIAESEVVR